LSFCSSLLSFRERSHSHLKLFSLLLGLTFIVECMAALLIKRHISNVPLYNVFMLVEFWTYGLYYFLIIGIPRMKIAIKWYLWLFPLFWIIVVFLVFGFRNWNSYVVIAGSFFTICFSCAYYYQLFTQSELVRLSKLPEFWIATALIIFYSCDLPYMGTLNFLMENYLKTAVQLLTALKVLDIIMYSIFIFAFLCRTIIKK